MDRLQPCQGIGDVGAKRDAHQENCACPRPPRHAHGDRRRGDQAFVRQFALHVEVAAQRTGADGEDDVVHRGAIDQAHPDRPEVVEGEAARVEHAVRRHLGVEARHREFVRAADELADEGAPPPSSA